MYTYTRTYVLYIYMYTCMCVYYAAAHTGEVVEAPPTFWHQVVDANSNHPYYWNPLTNEVSWTLPDGGVSTCTCTCIDIQCTCTYRLYHRLSGYTPRWLLIRHEGGARGPYQ